MTINNNNNDDFLIQDEINYSSKATGIKDLAIQQFQRCQEACSKELTSGGTRKVLIRGEVIDIIVPNTISTFCNSVRGLRETLAPKYLAKKEELKQFIDEYDKLKDDYNKWIKEKKQEMEIAKSNRHTDKNYQQLRAEYFVLKDEWDLELAHLEFRNLSLLMDKCKYFEESGGGM